ncbi:MAG: SDR family oxidoreductase [Candidatus Dadabacteria bacterium]|nr:SDR family oxidoreductase [Candidatus Dadabacteria bacterium]
MSKKLLVIGGSGELGYQIIRNSDSWKTFSTYHSNNLELKNLKSFKLDIRNKDEVEDLITRLKPHVVINCAVSDRSIKNIANEDDKKIAIVKGALNIARSCNKIGCRSVFISTDLVFDGKKGNYTESDTPNSLMSYGRYKAQMERELLELDYDLAVVRTSLIITLEPIGHQVSWIVNSLKNNVELNLFTDEYRSAIFGQDLAKAILELAENDYTGIINIAGPEALNRYQLGMNIANHFRLDTNMLKPVKAEDLGIERPLSCTLDSSKANKILKTKIRRLSDLI